MLILQYCECLDCKHHIKINEKNIKAFITDCNTGKQKEITGKISNTGEGVLIEVDDIDILLKEDVI
jgi:hypothetical protein